MNEQSETVFPWYISNLWKMDENQKKTQNCVDECQNLLALSINSIKI